MKGKDFLKQMLLFRSGITIVNLLGVWVYLNIAALIVSIIAIFL